MYLNRRPVLEARFPFFARDAVAGSMTATINLFQVESPQFESSWNPDAVVEDEREPTSSSDRVLSYDGQARISPNKDWRARKQEVAGQIAVEHAVRFQIDLMHNKVAPPADWPAGYYWFPVIGSGDVIQVTSVFTPQNMTMDFAPMDFNYVVRNISASSVSWLRTILADIVVNDQASGTPYGY